LESAQKLVLILNKIELVLNAEIHACMPFKVRNSFAVDVVGPKRKQIN
jgi:hypothetical protein